MFPFFQFFKGFFKIKKKRKHLTSTIVINSGRSRISIHCYWHTHICETKVAFNKYEFSLDQSLVETETVPTFIVCRLAGSREKDLEEGVTGIK